MEQMDSGGLCKCIVSILCKRNAEINIFILYLCFVQFDLFLSGKENCYVVSEFFPLKICLKFFLKTSEQITEVRLSSLYVETKLPAG